MDCCIPRCDGDTLDTLADLDDDTGPLMATEALTLARGGHLRAHFLSNVDGTGAAALTRALEIDYTAASLVAPELVRFRYRLEGVDRDWLEAGSRRQAFYTNLPPGKYVFSVMAANEDGVWLATDAGLMVRHERGLPVPVAGAALRQRAAHGQFEAVLQSPQPSQTALLMKLRLAGSSHLPCLRRRASADAWARALPRSIAALMSISIAPRSNSGAARFASGH